MDPNAIEDENYPQLFTKERFSLGYTEVRKRLEELREAGVMEEQ